MLCCPQLAPPRPEPPNVEFKNHNSSGVGFGTLWLFASVGCVTRETYTIGDLNLGMQPRLLEHLYKQ